MSILDSLVIRVKFHERFNAIEIHAEEVDKPSYKCLHVIRYISISDLECVEDIRNLYHGVLYHIQDMFEASRSIDHVNL